MRVPLPTDGAWACPCRRTTAARSLPSARMWPHRRRILALGAAAATSFAAAATTHSDQRPAPSIGILGTGWGLRVQTPQFKAAGLSVNAIYSRSSERAQTIAREHGIQHGFATVEELCASPDVDIVSCVGPTSTRCSQALTALQHGKHVLVDKPIGLSEAEGLELLKAARAAAGSSFMDFELRCVPAVVKAREILASGDLGSVLHVSFRVCGNFSFLTKGKHSHWAEREHGGGVFSAVGTHFVDLSRHLFGREVIRVSAIERPLVESLEGREVTSDGLTIATLELATKGNERRPLPISIYISGKSPGLPFENECTIVCENGSLKLRLLESKLTVYRNGEAEEVHGGGGNAWSDVGTPALGRALIGAINGAVGPQEPGGIDVRHLATLVDGCLVQRVTDAVHASAERGGVWLDVDPTPP